MLLNYMVNITFQIKNLQFFLDFFWKNILGLNNLAEGRTEVLNLYTTAMAFPRP